MYTNFANVMTGTLMLTGSLTYSRDKCVCRMKFVSLEANLGGGPCLLVYPIFFSLSLTMGRVPMWLKYC